MYKQAGCTEVNCLIDFSKTGLLGFFHSITADHCILMAGKPPAVRKQKLNRVGSPHQCVNVMLIGIPINYVRPVLIAYL